VEKSQISVMNLNNLWSFIEIYAVFVLNLFEEKSMWRKNDKYEVCLEVMKLNLGRDSEAGFGQCFKV